MIGWLVATWSITKDGCNASFLKAILECLVLTGGSHCLHLPKHQPLTLHQHLNNLNSPCPRPSNARCTSENTTGVQLFLHPVHLPSCLKLAVLNMLLYNFPPSTANILGLERIFAQQRERGCGQHFHFWPQVSQCG